LATTRPTPSVAPVINAVFVMLSSPFRWGGVGVIADGGVMSNETSS
jgi:hypothetical protein